MNQAPIFSTLIFEVRYVHGHLYLDRCGRIIREIEKSHYPWYMESTNPQISRLVNHELEGTMNYNADTFNINFQNVHSRTLEDLVAEAVKLWTLVKHTLELEKFTRMGCRMTFLKSFKTVDVANNRLLKIPFLQVNLTEDILKKDYQAKNSKSRIFLAKDEMEYAIELQTITRHEVIRLQPQVDPRFLSSNQREIRNQQLARISKAKRDPDYAIQMDVDCYSTNADRPADQFISDCHKNVTADFLPHIS